MVLTSTHKFVCYYLFFSFNTFYEDVVLLDGRREVSSVSNLISLAFFWISKFLVNKSEFCRLKRVLLDPNRRS